MIGYLNNKNPWLIELTFFSTRQLNSQGIPAYRVQRRTEIGRDINKSEYLSWQYFQPQQKTMQPNGWRSS